VMVIWYHTRNASPVSPHLLSLRLAHLHYHIEGSRNQDPPSLIPIPYEWINVIWFVLFWEFSLTRLHPSETHPLTRMLRVQRAQITYVITVVFKICEVWILTRIQRHFIASIARGCEFTSIHLDSFHTYE
jgi:hypothetical protein